MNRVVRGSLHWVAKVNGGFSTGCLMLAPMGTVIPSNWQLQLVGLFVSRELVVSNLSPQNHGHVFLLMDEHYSAWPP